MATVVETNTIKEALDLVEKAYECLKECERVYGVLKFDIRKDKKNRLKQKIASIEKNLQREIKK